MTVDVWVGLFSSEQRLEQYLEEVYDDDDSTPISEFAADMNEFFYDHDFFESSFQEQATQNLGPPLEEHSLASTGINIEPILKAFAASPTSFNAILLMWNEDSEDHDFPQITKPVSVQKPGVALRYLGRFSSETAK